MQFERPNGRPDEAELAAALHRIDPDARIAFDSENTFFEVVSSATNSQVLEALQALGCTAVSLASEIHISGGSTCCGGCS